MLTSPLSLVNNICAIKDSSETLQTDPVVGPNKMLVHADHVDGKYSLFGSHRPDPHVKAIRRCLLESLLMD